MIEACQQQGVQLMVCYYQRFNARHQPAIRGHGSWVSRALSAKSMAQARQCFLYPPQPDK
jgi:hypothetical protein